MKETAVEWIVNQLLDYDYAELVDNYYILKIPVWMLKEKREIARFKEKEQIMTAYDKGDLLKGSSEDYYKNIYGNF